MINQQGKDIFRLIRKIDPYSLFNYSQFTGFLPTPSGHNLHYMFVTSQNKPCEEPLVIFDFFSNFINIWLFLGFLVQWRPWLFFPGRSVHRDGSLHSESGWQNAARKSRLLEQIRFCKARNIWIFWNIYFWFFRLFTSNHQWELDILIVRMDPQQCPGTNR